MVMGSDNGGQGDSKGRSTRQQLKGGQLPVVGGGLVVGIATVVMVRVAGNLFSKLRKPKDLANNDTSDLTPVESLDKVIHEENSDLQINVEGMIVPTSEILLNGNRSTALNPENEGLDHNDPTTASDSVEPLDRALDVSAHGDIDTELSPGRITDSKLCPDKLDSGFRNDDHSKEGEDSSTASEVALSKLLNDALLDAKHESSSQHELLSNSKVLQDGVVGVIARAFDDYSYENTSSDELTPSKVKLTISWEPNSFSEKEVVQVFREPSLAETELFLLGSTEKETEEHPIERIKHDAEVSQDKEEAPEPHCPSLAPIEEQVSASGNDLSKEEEWSGATNLKGSETETGETLRTYVGNSESTCHEEVSVVQRDKIDEEVLEVQQDKLEDEVPVVQPDKTHEEVPVVQEDTIDEELPVVHQDKIDEELPVVQQDKIDEVPMIQQVKIHQEVPVVEDEIDKKGTVAQQGKNEHQSSTGVLQLDEIREVVAFADEVKIDKTSQEFDHFKMHAEEAKISVEVNSNLLRSKDKSLKEITPAQGKDSIQIPTTAEKENTVVIGTKKDTASPECDGVQKHADCTANAEVSVNVTSKLLKVTESSPSEMMLTTDENLAQISTQIAGKNGLKVAVTSLMVAGSSREITNLTNKEHKVAAGTRMAGVVADAQFITTAGDLKRKDSWSGNWLSLELLGSALIVVLIAILVWSISARDPSSIPSLH